MLHIDHQIERRRHCSLTKLFKRSILRSSRGYVAITSNNEGFSLVSFIQESLIHLVKLQWSWKFFRFVTKRLYLAASFDPSLLHAMHQIRIWGVYDPGSRSPRTLRARTLIMLLPKLGQCLSPSKWTLILIVLDLTEDMVLSQSYSHQRTLPLSQMYKPRQLAIISQLAL
jgi:hypothetical protein